MLSTENNFIKITIDAEKHFMHCKWLCHVSSQQFREGINLMVSALEQYEIKYWLAEASQLQTMTMADQQWLVREMGNRITSSKLIKIARIGNGDIFSYMAFENLQYKASNDYNYQAQIAQFTSKEEAIRWLGIPVED